MDLKGTFKRQTLSTNTKQYMAKTLKISILFDPEVLTLGTNPKENHLRCAKDKRLEGVHGSVVFNMETLKAT